MVNSIIEGILEFIFRFIIEIICFYTGEVIISLVTLSKKKPRWNYYTDDSATKFIILTEISVWIGIVFWIFIIGFIVKTLI